MIRDKSANLNKTTVLPYELKSRTYFVYATCKRSKPHYSLHNSVHSPFPPRRINSLYFDSYDFVHSNTHCQVRAFDRRYAFVGMAKPKTLASRHWNSNANRATFHGRFYEKLKSPLISRHYGKRLLG